MDNVKFEILKCKLNDLISMRTTYFSIGIVVSSGIVGLFYNLTSILNIILLLCGLFLDYGIMSTLIKINMRIKKIYKFMEAF